MWSRLSIAAIAGFAVSGARAYTFTGSHWYSSSITMQLELGSSSSPLSDGSSSWDAVAQAAFAIWNSNIGASQFVTVPQSTAPIAEGNGYNNVFFSGDVYGQAWGTGVLAVTLTFTTGSTHTSECDVLFNRTLSWDSYRGPLHYNSAGAVYDFRRVAIHEFGHVLGLDHPDQAGQSVVAIMNSRISNLDTVATDDITGAQVLYGANAATQTSPPTITSQPSSQTAVAGSSVSFTVGVSSGATATYQWTKNGAALTGATAATLTLVNVSSADAASYAVTVSNVGGSVTSNGATLTVTQPIAPPSIVAQPVSHTVSAGTSVTFNVAVTGSNPLSYSWQKNGAAIPFATAASYQIAGVGAANVGTYTVVVSNPAGTVTSLPATLTISPVTVTVPPTIITPPGGQTINAGDNLVLTVAANGTPAPAYQWQKNGSNLAGATNATLTVSPARPTDGGTYSVVVANAAGSVTTVPVLVTVNFSQLVNLSTRGFVPAGGALTAGFVLRGSPSKPIIVRGIGPTLNAFGVNDALADPQLALISQSTAQTLAVNSDWSNSPGLATAFQGVGAFPLPVGSADAASELQLAPGGYTTRVTADAAGSGGVALAEIYDAATADFATRLVNISSLGFAGAGDNALVAGFSIEGNAPKHVLIRAIGPGLAPYSVPNLLSDPRLDVYPLGQSAAIAGNDNWGGDPALSAAFATAGAFDLVRTSLDAAAVVTLQPGAYTVVVSGVGGTTGTALVEIYDLDP